MTNAMHRTLLLLPIILALPSAAQEVVGSGGGYHSDTGVAISYTIGEAMISTVSTGGTTLTQGFQQPWAAITTYNDEPAPQEGAITVYPNPVRHVLHVAMEGMPDGHRYVLHDAAGRQITDGNIASTITDINMETYASGGYILRILGPKNNTARSFKINVTH